MLRDKYRTILILISTAFLITACSPSTVNQDPGVVPTGTKVVLPDTWTPEPSRTPSPESTVSPESIRGSISTEYVPFEEIAMFTTQEGWAWGFIKDWGMRIWHTDDGGLTWVDVTPNPKAQKFVYALDGLTAWAVICHSTEVYCEEEILARTTDGGGTWSALSQAKYYSLWNMKFSSQEVGTRTEYDVGAGSGFWSFYQTNDGGSTWEGVEIHSEPDGDDLSFGKLQTCNMCGDLLYLDDELVMELNGNLNVQPREAIPISISRDRGASWTSIKLAFPDKELDRGTFHPNPPLVREDGTMILPVNLAPFGEESSDMVFYRRGSEGNWRVLSIVEDAGDIYSWNPFDQLSDQEIIFACGGDLCLSRDGAQSWERISSNLSFVYSQDKLHVDQFDFVDSQNGWALAEPLHRSYTLWHTTDGGLSWIEVEPSYILQ